MKIKNSDGSNLLNIYSKMVTANLEEEFFDKGYEVAVDAVALEEALKPFNKVRENAQKKIEGMTKEDPQFLPTLEKVNKEVSAAFEKEIEIKELSKISKDFIVKNKIKLSGIDIMNLKKFKAMD